MSKLNDASNIELDGDYAEWTAQQDFNEAYDRTQPEYPLYGADPVQVPIITYM